MNPLAAQLNQDIENGSPWILEMMSTIGKNLYFPKGILSQSAEAKEKAHKLNATSNFRNTQDIASHVKG